MSVTILSVEEIKGKKVRWLLDGRQRRNAFLQMYEDPENIYNWAKRFVGFKNNNQPSELGEMFWKKIDEYIEYSEEDETEKIDEDNSEDSTEVVESQYQDEECIDQKFGLDFLLEIIKMIHNKNKKIPDLLSHSILLGLFLNYHIWIMIKEMRNCLQKGLKHFWGSIETIIVLMKSWILKRKILFLNLLIQGVRLKMKAS